MQTVLTFVIPVRHPDNASNWDVLCRRLGQTIASIGAQTDKRWHCVIAASEGASLPPLPDQFSVVRVAFPPNPRLNQNPVRDDEFIAAVQWDKGRRVLAGMLAAPDSQFLMVVDDDDFVSRHLTEFVAANPAVNGWRVDRGWLWNEGGKLLLPLEDFSNTCGSSLIGRPELYRLPASLEQADPVLVKKLLGSHREPSPYWEEQGTPLSSLPFRAVVYRVDHAGSSSGARSFWRSQLLNRKNLQRPLESMSNFARIRPLSRTMRREFFGALA